MYCLIKLSYSFPKTDFFHSNKMIVEERVLWAFKYILSWSIVRRKEEQL